MHEFSYRLAFRVMYALNWFQKSLHLSAYPCISSLTGNHHSLFILLVALCMTALLTAYTTQRRRFDLHPCHARKAFCFLSKTCSTSVAFSLDQSACFLFLRPRIFRFFFLFVKNLVMWIEMTFKKNFWIYPIIWARRFHIFQLAEHFWIKIWR